MMMTMEAANGESDGSLKPISQYFIDKLSKEKQTITVEEIFQGKAWILFNVLSKEECKHIIEASEKYGYEKAETYCFLYRDRYNDRMMSDDIEFSNFIFNRTKEFLPNQLRGYAISKLNNRWRYCRYYKDHFFGGHTDGVFQTTKKENGVSIHEKSFYTFMLYLNSPKDGNYEGGNTNFLDSNTRKITKAVIPETGMALVFRQEDLSLLHEGAKLLSGTKYILRSDILYETRF